jgi:hypothetical protein
MSLNISSTSSSERTLYVDVYNEITNTLLATVIRVIAVPN